MKNNLTQQFFELEKMMIRNIANSLIQLAFHTHGTAEELQRYYGWTEPFEETERAKLIDDTRKRIECEQQILAFYQTHEQSLLILYGNKKPTGDLGLPPRQTISDSTDLGGTHQSAEEAGHGEGTEGGDGLPDNATEENNGSGRPEGRRRETGDGAGGTEGGGGDDRGGAESGEGTGEGEGIECPHHITDHGRCAGCGESVNKEQS